MKLIFITTIIFILRMLWWRPIWAIVNPNNETANIVVYLRKPNDMGPRSWIAGVNCLEAFSELYFQRREQLTRSLNVVSVQAYNLTTPAAQIQLGYLKQLNEFIGQNYTDRKYYQLRVISDAKMYNESYLNRQGLVLADYYVIVLDNVTRLSNLLRRHMLHSISWNPGAKFLVLYHNANDRNRTEETAMEIFAEMQRASVARVALLYATSATKYSLLALRYYHESNCRELTALPFGQCNDGKLNPGAAAMKPMLHKYFNAFNAKNCTFHLCASILAPYVESDCIEGIEMKLIGFLKDRLKFKLNQTCSYDSRGVEDDFNEFSGLLGKLDKKSCDFIIGGFYPDNDVTEKFWVTDCYLQDRYTWFVKLANPRPIWLALCSIFDTSTWLSLIGMLFISWMFWYIFVTLLPEPRKSKDFSLTGINNLAVVICVSVNERPFCHASRMFFLALTLYGLNVSTTYASKLISVLTDPGLMHQLNSLPEVVAAGIPFGGSEESRDWFENEEDQWIFDNYNDSLDFQPTSTNLEAVRLGERVILSSRMYMLQNKIVDDLYAFQQNVFSSPVQMIMKPGFPFLFEFNLLIRRMRDFGILEKINDDFHYNNTYLNRIHRMRPDFTVTVTLRKNYKRKPIREMDRDVIAMELNCSITPVTSLVIAILLRTSDYYLALETSEACSSRNVRYRTDMGDHNPLNKQEQHIRKILKVLTDIMEQNLSVNPGNH
uniref:Ionotropic glutamate receptor C-terminal domain-containing protein n=1 Tax=Glossina pallidipes TaxID=7398 RepID=A0A1A9ZW92_GLOPL